MPPATICLFMFLTLTRTAVCVSSYLSSYVSHACHLSRSYLSNNWLLPCLVVHVKFQFLYTTKIVKLDFAKPLTWLSCLGLHLSMSQLLRILSRAKIQHAHINFIGLFGYGPVSWTLALLSHFRLCWTFASRCQYYTKNEATTALFNRYIHVLPLRR